MSRFYSLFFYHFFIIQYSLKISHNNSLFQVKFGALFIIHYSLSSSTPESNLDSLMDPPKTIKLINTYLLF